MKSIKPKEFYYTIMLKSQLKKKNILLFTVHSHQLFLISINKSIDIYFLLSLTKIV